MKFKLWKIKQNNHLRHSDILLLLFASRRNPFPDGKKMSFLKSSSDYWPLEPSSISLEISSRSKREVFRALQLLHIHVQIFFQKNFGNLIRNVLRARLRRIVDDFYYFGCHLHVMVSDDAPVTIVFNNINQRRWRSTAN